MENLTWNLSTIQPNQNNQTVITDYDNNNYNINITECDNICCCDDVSLTTRELLIIVGFTIVILIFIIYHIINFFELTANSFCKKTNRKSEVQDIIFKDSFEIPTFYSNITEVEKKSVSTQTEYLITINESK